MTRGPRLGATPPLDFADFWTRTLDALGTVKPDVRSAGGQEEGPLILEKLSFLSMDHARIQGYLLRWKNDQPRPLVVHGHGYGSACEVQWRWARMGFDVAGVDVRGYGGSQIPTPPSRWGYALTGIESPETSVLRGAVCDYIRAVEVARERVSLRMSRLILQGTSFAGALALMAEAWLGASDLLVVGVPTLGWAEGRLFFVRDGSGAEISRYLDARPEHTEDVMLVLKYFDPVNFAPRVRCPTLVGVGMSDAVVPPDTVYAIARHLAGPYEIMQFPVSHTALPEEKHWDRFEERWMELARDGVPKTFGTGSDPHPANGRVGC